MKAKAVHKETGPVVGEITGFAGSWHSGLATLYVDGKAYHGDNAPLCRALDGALGGFITPGHCVDPSAIVGRRVALYVGDFGLIEGLVAEEDYDGG